MPLVGGDGDRVVVGVADLDAFGAPAVVVDGLHGEPGFSGCRADQFDDGAYVVRDRPRQFIEMNENNRCSICSTLMCRAGSAPR